MWFLSFIFRIAAISLVLFLFACETVIEVDLNEAEPKIAIEAILIEGPQTFQVKVTETTSYFSNSAPKTLDGAQVQLTQVGAATMEIPQTGPGLYALELTAIAENTYQLEVTIDERQYVAQSYLNPAIQLDSISYEFQEATPFFDEGYLVFSEFTDPEGIENYYRVLYDLNGEPQREADDFQVVDDRVTDGNDLELPLFGKTFLPGDHLLMELRSLDEAGYDYYTSLANIIGANSGPRGGSAAPGNPVSNWSGDVLGYFIAYSSDTLSVVIP